MVRMERIESSARDRIAACRHQQMESIAAVRGGVPLAAEPDPERAAQRVEAQVRLAPEATLLRHPPIRAVAAGGPERIWGPTQDFVGVAFLERGMNAARTVGRVAFSDGRPNGTGFLAAPGLFLTNNHVLESEQDCRAFVVEFDYEVDALGQRRPISRFELAPDEFFITDERDDLDYTLVALGRRLEGASSVESFGYSGLSDAGNKHTLGEVANIVQHPDGRLKEAVLRENRLVSRLSHVLHYVADTEPGSSGSPVFNNQWQAIALHHWGGPWRQDRGPDGAPVPRFVNEGIRVSAIVGELRERREELGAAQRRRLDEALDLGESTGGLPVRRPTPSPAPDGGVEVRPDGTAVWRVPIEIAVGVPGFARTAAIASAHAEPLPLRAPSDAEAFRRKVDRDYDNRKGFRERFLSGHRVPLPAVAGEVAARLARNLQAGPGDDPVELPYEHFSVYLDGTRGLPLLTACNIDGRNLKSINRSSGRVTRAEGLEDDPVPEARETWYDDPRVEPGRCGDDRLYLDQSVSAGRNRLGRIFHRGHMVRRLDPCWGSDRSALRAEADTFHFTNCTPQVGAFNSGRSLWQGIENHVLDNARVDDLRVCVFTGPVLAVDDPPYRQDVFPGFRVPLRFWKVAVWEDGGELAALALLADQAPVLREIPEGAEDLGDVEELEEFIATVPWIEEMTGLDFGEAVRSADLHEEVGPEAVREARRVAPRRVRKLVELPLHRIPARRVRPERPRRKGRPKSGPSARGDGS